MKLINITLRGDIPQSVVDNWDFTVQPDGNGVDGDVLYSGTFGENVQVQALRHDIETNGGGDFEMFLASTEVTESQLGVVFHLDNADDVAVDSVNKLVDFFVEKGANVFIGDMDEEPIRFVYWSETTQEEGESNE